MNLYIKWICDYEDCKCANALALEIKAVKGYSPDPASIHLVCRECDRINTIEFSSDS